MLEKKRVIFVILATLLFPISLIQCATDKNDVGILNEFKNGVDNPELLQWPENDDDPCGNKWKHVFCNGDRVSQIQVQGLGLNGTLPKDFNQLSKLYNIGLQRNQFHGSLPSFSRLSELEFVYLDYNNFDEIPDDFFDGLSSVRVIALNDNPLNGTKGWSLPDSVGKLTQLVNLSLGNCGLWGSLPDSVGTLPSLNALKLPFNRLSGVLPSSFNQSMLQTLWLNDQAGAGMSGPIDVIASMPYLTQAWLHGNSFTGTIPDGIGELTSLKDLNLNRNKLVGTIPQGLAGLDLDTLNLNNNMFMGSIPKFKAKNVSYESNSFCQPAPGVECAPQVNALVDFLGGVSYPNDLVPQWSGNDPCGGSWLGVTCDSDSKVAAINLPNRHLNGTLSPSLASLDSLRDIRLAGNNLHGQIPTNISQLKSLRSFDVSDNNFEPPLPRFHTGVKLAIDGNPLLVSNHSGAEPPASISNPPTVGNPPIVQSPLPSAGAGVSQGGVKAPSPKTSHSSVVGSSPRTNFSHDKETKHSKSEKVTLIVIVSVVCSLVVLVVLLVLLYMFCCKKKKRTVEEAPISVVVHPTEPCDANNVAKVAVSSNNTGSLFTQTASSSESRYSSGVANSHVFESGNLVVSVQVLRKVTNNFAPENQLGRGGFGVVYKGELEDGTKIAVKRMEASVIYSKQLDEFQAEIAVLSKVRHRHLVSLFGYSIEGSERLLVYEYMPKGALSTHLFRWRNLNLEPLSWKSRLSIALDVARGMEYLHTLAHQSFIHRDLKSSNILLDDEYRAKVSDFGLVKLAPDREKSVATRLAGTFGYLAPEYAVTGKVSTKIDVFSFGVVLMELVTGLMALDEERSEERRYLAEWFWRIKSNKETLMAAVDPILDINEAAFETIGVIADLAGHCTARDPSHRPDMGHAVSVLAPLVDKWKPIDDETEDYMGIDFNLPLTEMLKGWQRGDKSKDNSCCTSLDDSRGSIPARPTGFADSFTSADAR